MGKITFTLHSTLKQLKISGNRLAVEAKVRPTTVYNILENDSTRMNIETLTKLLDALNSIAEEDGIRREFSIEDIIKYTK